MIKELETIRRLAAEYVDFIAGDGEGIEPELIRRAIEEGIIHSCAWIALPGGGPECREGLAFYLERPLRQVLPEDVSEFGRVMTGEINAALAAGADLPEWMLPYPRVFHAQKILDHVAMLIAREKGRTAKLHLPSENDAAHKNTMSGKQVAKKKSLHCALNLDAHPKDCYAEIDPVTRWMTVHFHGQKRETILTHKQIEILTKAGKPDKHSILRFTNRSLERVFGTIPLERCNSEGEEVGRKTWHQRVRSAIRHLRNKVRFVNNVGFITENPNTLPRNARVKGAPPKFNARIDATHWNTTIPIHFLRER